MHGAETAALLLAFPHILVVSEAFTRPEDWQPRMQVLTRAQTTFTSIEGMWQSAAPEEATMEGWSIPSMLTSLFESTSRQIVNCVHLVVSDVQKQGKQFETCAENENEDNVRRCRTRGDQQA